MEARAGAADCAPVVDRRGAGLPLGAGAAARGATPRGRILASAARYAAGARATAVAEAVRRVLAEADVGPGAITHVLAGPADAEALRPLGIEAPAHDEAPGTLGAAALIAAARWLASHASGAGLALACAGDPEGAGSAVLFQA